MKATSNSRYDFGTTITDLSPVANKTTSFIGWDQPKDRVFVKGVGNRTLGADVLRHEVFGVESQNSYRQKLSKFDRTM